MGVKFYNGLSREVEDFVPLSDKKVTLYTCGPTVYDFAHIGNFRAYIFEDLLHRVLRFNGYEVSQVMNLTDVDDKTIRNSLAKGVSLDEYTKPYKEAFFEDIKALGIIPAQVYPEATRHIPEMIEIIQTLLEKGHAYQKDGSIYFKISSFEAYGKLAHLDREGLVAGASGRVESDEYEKEDASDFVLWKGQSERDGAVIWDSPFGPGRPGWHIECSAMSMKYLGPTIDIHTGGVDNLFPHHENEIAQSEAATGKPFVRYWLHCAWLLVENEKMSKSKGNFFTFRNLQAQGWSAKVIRYLLLATHYRKTLNFSTAGLEAAKASLTRLETFLADLGRESSPGDQIRDELRALTDQLTQDFTEAISDDLNISEALAAIFISLPKFREAFPLNARESGLILETFKRLDEVLNLFEFADEDELEPELEKILAERTQARLDKNFSESDRLRDLLLEKGIAVKDTPRGTIWERVK